MTELLGKAAVARGYERVLLDGKIVPTVYSKNAFPIGASLIRWRHGRAAIGLNLRTTTLQKCAAVPRRARIQGSQTFVSHNSRLESN